MHISSGNKYENNDQPLIYGSASLFLREMCVTDCNTILKREIEAVMKKGRKCKNDGTDEDFDAFLSDNAGICIAGRNVGPHLTKNQIFRYHLLNQISCRS